MPKWLVIQLSQDKLTSGFYELYKLTGNEMAEEAEKEEEAEKRKSGKGERGCVVSLARQETSRYCIQVFRLERT